MTPASSLVSLIMGGSEKNPPVETAPEKMRQWTTALDGLDKLRLDEVDMPAPAEGEVLVKIHAVGLNYRDVTVCRGLERPVLQTQQTQQKDAIVPCSDMCGTVVESRSNLLRAGTRVASIFHQTHLQGALDEDDLASGLGLPLPGVLAEYRVFAACSLVQVPAYLSDEEASCLTLAAVTAWTCLNWMHPHPVGSQPPVAAASDKFVLFQGTGDVAVAGLQMAHAAGYKTIITSSSDDKLKRAKDQLKADQGINHKTHWEWQDLVIKATNGRGADIILDTGGARTLRKSFDSVAFGGVINCLGSSTDNKSPVDKTPQLHRLDVNALALRRNVTLRGIIVAGKDRFQDMLGFYEENKIRPVVGKVFAFDEAKDAMVHLAESEDMGKVVIKMGNS